MHNRHSKFEVRLEIYVCAACERTMKVMTCLQNNYAGVNAIPDTALIGELLAASCTAILQIFQKYKSWVDLQFMRDLITICSPRGTNIALSFYS